MTELASRASASARPAAHLHSGQPASPVMAASLAERRFWTLQQATRDGVSANTCARIRIEGPLDVEALTSALRATRRRHEALRTAWRLDGAALTRQVLDEPPEHDLLVLPTGASSHTAARTVCGMPLDATTGAVMRAALVPARDGGDLYLSIHHIAFDGASGEVLCADLATAYAAALRGDPVELPGYRHRPATPPLAADRRRELREHWARLLADTRDLPCDGAPLAHSDLVRRPVASLPVEVDARVAAGLRRAARQRAMTVFPLALTAYARALAEHGAPDSFCVGVAVAERPPDAEHEVGCMFGMLPVPVSRPWERHAVERTWQALIAALAGSALPLEQIRSARPGGDARRMPVYQATLLYQNWPRRWRQAGPARMRTMPAPPLAPQAEVLVEVDDPGQGALTGHVQAPAGACWAQRLPMLADTFRAALCDLADAAARAA